MLAALDTRHYQLCQHGHMDFAEHTFDSSDHPMVQASCDVTQRATRERQRSPSQGLPTVTLSQPVSGLLPQSGAIGLVPHLARSCLQQNCLLKGCFPRLQPLQCHCLMCLAEEPLLVVQEAILLAVGGPGWEVALWVLAACPQKGMSLVAATAVVPAGRALAVPCHDLEAALVSWLEAHSVLELAMVAVAAALVVVVVAAPLQAAR